MRNVIFLLFTLITSNYQAKEKRLPNSGVLTGDISLLGINCDELIVINTNQQVSAGSFSYTVPVINGKFEFRYHTDESKFATILLLYKKNKIGQLTFINTSTKNRLHFMDVFYLDNSLTKISVQKKRQIPGSSNIPVFPVNITGSPETSLFFSIERLDNRNKQVTKELVLNNRDSYFLLQKLYENSFEYSSEVLDNLYELFSNRVKKSSTYKKLGYNIAKGKRLNSNGFRGGFPLVDTAGKSYSFEKVSQGKPILLIYWASWCKPCRAEIPELKNLYRLYSNKVKMVSLSIDKEYENWKSAVQQESMPWVNLSGLPRTPTKVSNYYGIKAIPTMILLNHDGKQVVRVNNDLNQIKKVLDSYEQKK